jgi:hypothetical protein
MAIFHGMPLLHPVVAGDALMIRALHDFDEMPALRLTTAQAMRLWNLERPTCQKLLDTLVDAHLLQIDAAGQYARPASEFQQLPEFRHSRPPARKFPQ